MKTFFYLLFAVLPFQKNTALNIAQVRVSNYSEKEINICLTTEAVELYYFQSWHYSISENIITIEACFIPGFGSTIAYLNNDFHIPINATAPQDYRLIVNAYYNFYTLENLQDSEEGFFGIPITESILLPNYSFSKEVFFPNPTTGKLFFDRQIKSILVYDVSGKNTQRIPVENGVVDLSNNSTGVYIIRYFRNSRLKTIRIILLK